MASDSYARIIRLLLERRLNDEVLFYSIARVNDTQQLYYLCLCSHFFYLLRQGDGGMDLLQREATAQPLQFRYEQLQRLTCDPDCISLISLRLVNSSKNTMELILDVSNREALVREIAVHFRTNFAIKSWSVVPTTTSASSVTATSAPGSSETVSREVRQVGVVPIFYESVLQKPRSMALHFSSIIKHYKSNTSSLNVHQIHGQYFFALIKDFVLKSDNEKHCAQSPASTFFGSDAFVFEAPSGTAAPAKLTVTILEPRNMIRSAKMSLKTLADKMASGPLLRERIDFRVTKDEPFTKQEFLFSQDSSVWDGHVVCLETLPTPPSPSSGPAVTKSITVVTLRRMLLAPDADMYQDFVVVLEVPLGSTAAASAAALSRSATTLQKSVFEAVASLQPMPQVFMYDTMLLRAKLDALTFGQSWLYGWCRRALGMKPELRQVGQETASNRADEFAKSILDLLNGKEGGASPFTIEADIVANIDAPASQVLKGDRREWRQRLSRYLAFFTGDDDFGTKGQKLNLELIVQTMKKEPGQSQRFADLRRLVNYFLHLRPLKKAYDFDGTLESKIDEVEHVTNNVLTALYHEYESAAAPAHMQKDDAAVSKRSQSVINPQQHTVESKHASVDEGSSAHLEEEKKIEALNVQWAHMRQSRDVCAMNVAVFLRLLQLDYFQVIGLPMEAQVKLITYALRLSDESDFDTLAALCDTVALRAESDKTFIKCLIVYTPFLHALSALLQYDDTELLSTVGRILLRLQQESSTAKRFLIANDVYARYILHHLDVNKTMPQICAMFCKVLRQCMDSVESCLVIGRDADGASVLSRLLSRCAGPAPSPAIPVILRIACSEDRMDLLENVSSCLWTMSASDESVIALATQQAVVDSVTNALQRYDCTMRAQVNLLGLAMTVASYVAHRQRVLLRLDLLEVAAAVARQVVLQKHDQEDQYGALTVALLRNALGCMLMMSSFSMAIQKLKALDVTSTMKELVQTKSLMHGDDALQVIAERLAHKLHVPEPDDVI